VTAVASAQGSAARRQPQQGQGRRAPVQQAPRKGDAPVSLVGADEPAGADGSGPVRQKGSGSRRPQRNSPKSVPGAGSGASGDAAPPRQGKRARGRGAAEAAPQDTAVAPEATGENAVLDGDGGTEEADLDVVVTLEGVDLDAVDLEDFAVEVDVDLEVDVDIEDVPDDIDVADIDDSLAEIEAEDTEDEAAPAEEAAGPADGPEATVAVSPAAPPGEGTAAPARSGEEGDDETFVYGDDDDDLPAAQVASAGATADPVKDYLKQIGKVPLLNAE
jgi:RNA polymerase primary sigma factor